jgi:hypothetical protein
MGIDVVGREQFGDMISIFSKLIGSVRHDVEVRSSGFLPGSEPIPIQFDRLGRRSRVFGSDLNVSEFGDISVIGDRSVGRGVDLIEIDSLSCNDIGPLGVGELWTCGRVNNGGFDRFWVLRPFAEVLKCLFELRCEVRFLNGTFGKPGLN